MVYWNNKDVVAAIIGGALIAISTTLNLYFYGRITGLSGIFNSVIKHDVKGGFEWKTAFFMGLLTIPVLAYQIFGNAIIASDLSWSFILFDSNEYADSKQGLGAWILGGLLVGWGTRMGNGCTSGHGVCGMPRFAPRSIAAVCTFMAAGVAVATFRYHVPFFTDGSTFGASYAEAWRWVSLAIFIAGLVFAGFRVIQSPASKKELLINYGLGVIFGAGLLISGMCKISKIMGFLTLNEYWDPSLIFVMMSAVAINVITFNYILSKVPYPIMLNPGSKYSVPPKGTIDARLLGGAAIFGCGWGLSGLCPGPGVICFFSLDHALIWCIALAIGQVAFDFTLEAMNKQSPPAVNEGSS